MMYKNTQTDAQMASHMTSIGNLEVQMGQISQALNSRPKGALPSNTVQMRENGELWGNVTKYKENPKLILNCGEGE